MALFGCGEEPLPTSYYSEMGLIQAEVFDVVCSECHNQLYPAGGLDLSNEEASYASLVGVSASNRVASDNGWLLVNPGVPELSFLMRKLRTPGVGEGGPMPPGDHELTDAFVEVIAAWIEGLDVAEVSL